MNGLKENYMNANIYTYTYIYIYIYIQEKDDGMKSTRGLLGEKMPKKNKSEKEK